MAGKRGTVAAQPSSDAVVDGDGSAGIVETSGNGENGNDNIDGIAVVSPIGNGNDAGNSGGSVKRGRGRPAGAGKPRIGKREVAAPVSIKGIEKILFSIHAMAASSITPELALEEQEAKLLAEAVAEVQSHYNMTVDPKIVAWIGLAGVCGSLYGPRIAAYKLRKMTEEPMRPKAEKSTVNGAAGIPSFDTNSLVSVPNTH